MKLSLKSVVAFLLVASVSLVGALTVNAASLGTVVAWGDNRSGQTNVPAGLSGVASVAAGTFFTVALKSDGTVVAWGNNGYGQLNIPAGLSGVAAISASHYHTIALKTNGTVVAWGYNYNGQTTVPAGLSGVMAIAAGDAHSVALKTNGTVVAWGLNDSGQTTVPAGLNGVAAIAAGFRFTGTLRTNGTVVAWGLNGSGQTNVPAGLSGVAAIAAGGDYDSCFTAALKNDGTVLVWGNNDYGQTNVPVGLSGVIAIAAGGSHMVALKGDGTVVAWGSYSSGKTTVPAGLSGVAAIAAGYSHSVALRFVPAAITQQPHSTTVTTGGTVTFTVTTTGTPLLSFQWQKERLPIAEATNNFLTLTNVTFNDSGNYGVVATNSYGSVTSSNAVLQVLPANAPSIKVNSILAVGTLTVGASESITITGGFPGGFLFYTLDGSTPTTSATFYTGPFSITNSATLRAMSLSADFTQTSEAPAIDVVVLPVYPLATSLTGSGVVIVSPPNGPYISNSVVTLTAASTNWAFDHWSGDLSGSANPANLTMNGPRSVQAVFVRTAYPLTLSTPGGGSVTANNQSIGANTYYPTGSVVLLEATASSGWSFLRWQGTASSAVNPFNISMNQTQNVQAVFGTAVTSNIAGSGSIVMSVTNPVPYGTVVTHTAIPSLGYYFLVWSGAASGTNNPTVFMVTMSTPVVGALFVVSPSLPKLALQFSAGYPLLDLYGMLGRDFIVQYNTNLAESNWLNLLALTNLSASPYQFLDPAGSSQPARFYRAFMQ